MNEYDDLGAIGDHALGRNVLMLPTEFIKWDESSEEIASDIEERHPPSAFVSAKIAD